MRNIKLKFGDGECSALMLWKDDSSNVIFSNTLETIDNMFLCGVAINRNTTIYTTYIASWINADNIPTLRSNDLVELKIKAENLMIKYGFILMSDEQKLLL